MTARVLAVTAAATAAGSTTKVSGSMSTSTARAPHSSTTLAVAGNVYAGTITSSPGPISSARSARCSAAVPDDTAAAWAVPTALAIAASNSSTFGPIVSWPVAITSSTAASSASPTSGRASRIGSLMSRVSPGTTRWCVRALRRDPPWPRSRAALAPCPRSGSEARRPCSGGAGRRSPRSIP